MKVHEIKIHSDFFNATVNGSRRSEIVKNEDMQLGDQLILRENTFEGITERFAIAKITYIQKSYTALLRGYSVVNYMLLNVCL